MDNRISLTFSELDPATLVGAPIRDRDGETVGEVVGMHGTGAPSGIVVGFGGREVSVPVNEVDFVDADGKVCGILTWTRAELEAMPDQAPVS